MLDARIDDDDALEQQFSAIALNDNRANSPVEVEQSVVRNEGINTGLYCILRLANPNTRISSLRRFALMCVNITPSFSSL